MSSKKPVATTITPPQKSKLNTPKVETEEKEKKEEKIVKDKVAAAVDPIKNAVVAQINYQLSLANLGAINDGAI